MALVMIVVEIASALLVPAAEVVAPLFVLFWEFLFWVVLLVVELLIALFCWRKPKLPSRHKFNGVRNKLKSFSNSWRNKREEKKPRNINS